MNIIEKQAVIENELYNLENLDDKFTYLIEKGMSMEEYPLTYKTEGYLIKECQSKLWLFCIHIDNKITFIAHSETVIVRGIVAVLLEVYSGNTPLEIINTPFTVFEKSGISKILSSRNTGINAIIQKVNVYARQFL